MAAPTSEVIRLENVRLSFPKLFKAEAFQEGQEKKFQATGLLDPSDASHAAKIKEIKQAAGALLKEAGLTSHELDGVCFGDGNKKVKKTKDGKVVREGYENMFYVSVNNTTRPAVANRRGEPVSEGDPGCPYAGCYVNITLTLWVQDNQYGKRINGNLRGVQFVKDGEAFGNAPVSVDSEFEALEDSAGGSAGETSDWDDDISF